MAELTFLTTNKNKNNGGGLRGLPFGRIISWQKTNKKRFKKTPHNFNRMSLILTECRQQPSAAFVSKEFFLNFKDGLTVVV